MYMEERKKRKKQAQEREARMRQELNLVRIDPTKLVLNDALINHDLFQATMRGLIYQYAHPVGHDVEQHYRSWFWHVPRDVYFDLSEARKIRTSLLFLK